MEPKAIVQTIVSIIHNHLPSEYKSILFGSFARGDALKTSDIDIGIIGKQKVPWEIMVKIKQEIDDIPTLRSIEIVDLNTVDDVFKNKALAEGKVLS